MASEFSLRSNHDQDQNHGSVSRAKPVICRAFVARSAGLEPVAFSVRS